MKITVEEFVNEFVEKKIANTKVKPNAVEDFIKGKLDIVEYLPFNTKREVVTMVVDKVVREEDGVKKVDSMAKFLSFITAMLISHTNLQIVNPEEDYDALSKHGLLEPIVAMFQKDYTECDALLKATIADELADNNLNVIIGKFLNGILGKLDGIGDVAKGFIENFDVTKLLGTDINKEEIAKLVGLLNKIK